MLDAITRERLAALPRHAQQARPTPEPVSGRFIVRDVALDHVVASFPGDYRGRRDARRLADDMRTQAEPDRFVYEAQP